MTATMIELNYAHTVIGQQLDQLSHANADEQALDEIIAAMRQLHERIAAHLAVATRPTSPAPIRSRSDLWSVA